MIIIKALWVELQRKIEAEETFLKIEDHCQVKIEWIEMVERQALVFSKTIFSKVIRIM